MTLPKGVYALTGANGSGKSTLFRVLMSCSTNKVQTDLPSSIKLHNDAKVCTEDEQTCAAPLTDKDTGGHVDDNAATDDSLIIMPSSDVSEISQTFYWPLYARPIDWIHQTHLPDTEEAKAYTTRVAVLLDELEFMQAQPGQEQKQVPDAVSDSSSSDGQSSHNSVQHIISQLTEQKEDWFSDLSGGQKSKVELVRKVFIHDACPSVLLIDETFAPLDPVSKSLVMAKLKNFCQDSVVLVIYHTDVQGSSSKDSGGSDGSAQNDGDSKSECVPSNDFFDHNIHLDNRTLNIRPVC